MFTHRLDFHVVFEKVSSKMANLVFVRKANSFSKKFEGSEKKSENPLNFVNKSQNPAKNCRDFLIPKIFVRFFRNKFTAPCFLGMFTEGGRTRENYVFQRCFLKVELTDRKHCFRNTPIVSFSNHLCGRNISCFHSCFLDIIFKRPGNRQNKGNI